MNKNQILSGIWKFLKGLFFGLLLIVAVVTVVSLFSSNEKIKSTPEVTQEQKNISVTSQNVKEVGGKYRYFFNIKNNDNEPFAGDVNIDLINAEGGSVYDKTFSSSQAIAPGLGTSVYFDINTGPTSVHGMNGIKTFSFTAKVNGQVVKSGSGSISVGSQ
ncbi:MAG: hypothetical protein WC893_00855 [Candidatus Paceibacterota bacterium]|jgi:hypothetical protein